MPNKFRWSLLAAAFLVCLPLWSQVEFHEGKEVSAHEVLVKFRAISPQQRALLRSEHGIDREEQVGSTGFFRLHSLAKNATALLQALRTRGDVEFVEPNYIVHAIAIPNDPQFANLYAMRNTGQTVNGTVGIAGADIKAYNAWDISKGTTNVVVGVVDTGVDYTHPDLGNNVWSAPQSFTVTVAGRTLTCPAGSHGFNAIAFTCDPRDDNQHGTHVSGTIGALGNNSVGVVGVNWIASIVGLKFLNAQGSGTTADAINAIEFAVQIKQVLGTNVRVLSNSWGGGGFSQALLDEINKANTNNMLFVAAAGNAGSNNDVTANFPSNYNAPNVVAVAATDNRDGLASFSNFGATTVDLGAPGVNILSTIPNNSYAFFNGTSMATPHVSGAAALVLAVCTLTTAELKANLMNNVDPIPSLSGKSVTGGRLNVDKAIRACNPTPNFTISASPASVSVVQGGSGTSTITTTVSGGFNSAISLSASGAPAGTTVSFSPASIAAPGSGTSTMTLAVGAATATGTYTITVTGTGGAVTHTTTVTLTVTAPPVPDFTISASPASLSVVQGNSGSSTITTSATGGFNNAIALSASGAPAGVSVSFNPASIAAPGSGSSTMTLAVAASTVAGTYTITVTGTGGGTTHTANVALTVTTAPTPNFTLSASPASLSVVQGGSGNSTITTAATNGFNNAISLSATGAPAGTTVSFNPTSIAAPGNGSSTLTLAVGATTATGTYTITVTAAGGGVTHTVSVTLTVTTSAPRQLLGNPGFETGSAAPWVATAGVIDSFAGQPAHSGAWKAWLDGYGTTHTDTLYQQVTIPSTATTANLTFWLHIDTSENTTTTAFDTLRVQIRNSAGTLLATLATYSNLNAAPGYIQRSFNVIAYKGQTIRVYFLGMEDSSLQTSFVIDDTALNVQ